VDTVKARKSLLNKVLSPQGMNKTAAILVSITVSAVAFGGLV
jgi:hypothetical protein